MGKASCKMIAWEVTQLPCSTIAISLIQFHFVVANISGPLSTFTPLGRLNNWTTTNFGTYLPEHTNNVLTQHTSRLSMPFLPTSKSLLNYLLIISINDTTSLSLARGTLRLKLLEMLFTIKPVFDA